VAQLGTISGVGEKKLATYGEGVIGVLAGLGDAPEVAPTATPAPTPAAAATAATKTTAAARATPTPTTAADPGADYWPEMDMEPEPEDWI
jgi:ATP-dependent DNA helicase RecQ